MTFTIDKEAIRCLVAGKTQTETGGVLYGIVCCSCRKDPEALQEMTVGEKDWVQWWMWSLHYALWNMDATDEALSRMRSEAPAEDKENLEDRLRRPGKRSQKKLTLPTITTYVLKLTNIIFKRKKINKK